VSIAGAVGVAGLEWLRPGPARAQGTGPRAALVSNFRLLYAVVTTPPTTTVGEIEVPGLKPDGTGEDPLATLRIVNVAYRYDYRSPSGRPEVPPRELIRLFRDIPRLVGFFGISLSDGETNAELRKIPVAGNFTDPSQVPYGFPSPPPLRSMYEANCFLLTQPVPQDDEGETPGSSNGATTRVYEWCTFYSQSKATVEGEDGTMVMDQRSVIRFVIDGVTIDSTTVPTTFRRSEGDAVAAIINQPNITPVVQGFDRYTSTDALGGVYYGTKNFSTSDALWRGAFPVANGQRLLVEAYIPGASPTGASPAKLGERTATARFEIQTGESSIPVVKLVDQNRATSGWVDLGTYEFVPGDFHVKVTGLTNEPLGRRDVVVNAVRWRNV
jgi:hypothetical protein